MGKRGTCLFVSLFICTVIFIRLFVFIVDFSLLLLLCPVGLMRVPRHVASSVSSGQCLLHSPDDCWVIMDWTSLCLNRVGEADTWGLNTSKGEDNCSPLEKPWNISFLMVTLKEMEQAPIAGWCFCWYNTTNIILWKS